MDNIKESVCLKCGGTGIQVDGSNCDCVDRDYVNTPIVLEIPSIYQTAEFSAMLVPVKMPRLYGIELEDIINVIKSKGRYTHNLLICSPPNTGKTVFAYTVYKHQYLHGIPMSELMDLIEVKELLNSNSYDDSVMRAKDKLITSPVSIVKIPLDLPSKFAEIMSTYLERKVRKNGIVIYLYGGSISDLQNQDRYGVLKNLIRDGSYNSIKVLNYVYSEG